MEIKNKNIDIFRCEFCDKDLEKEFFNYDMNRKKYIRPLLLIASILFILFIIPDYYLVNEGAFHRILISRSIYFIFALIWIYYIRDIKKPIFLSSSIVLFEVLGFVVYLYIIYQYNNPNYYFKTMDILIGLLFIILIPNKWMHSFFTTLFICINYFIFSFKYFNISFNDYLGEIVYVLIVLFLTNIAAYYRDYNKRIEYLINKELSILSKTDSLTGIYNRLKFEEELYKWFEINKIKKTLVSILLIDFDDFKKINDTYGHIMGDEVIVKSTNLIKRAIRKTDIFARWGGEEFVILLPDTDKVIAIKLAHRIRKTISEYTFENVGKVTCSIGVAELEENNDILQLMSRVDKLLYLAKEAGKNVVKCG